MRKIVFLPTTHHDLKWFHRYYTSVFPDGRQKALGHYKAMLQTLRSNPHVGHPSASRAGLRELPIPRTPFVLLYRVTPRRIEILRVLDGRAETP